MISTIIPTYKSPEFLELCLRSCVTGQSNKNEIIVVIDGFYGLNKPIIDKWQSHIKTIVLEENFGLCQATNIGVYYASNDKILIVNDDNVFPEFWDVKLEAVFQQNTVIAPNQIEPLPSIFRQFHIKNLGNTATTFDLAKFWEYEKFISKDSSDSCGSTLPIFMSRIDYWTVGGWDTNYQNGMVADWDFFLKCKLSKMNFLRTYNTHFYHFGSVSVNSNSNREKKEKFGKEYAAKKWSKHIQHNNFTNEKFL